MKSCSETSERRNSLELPLTLCCYSKMKSTFRNWSDVRVFLAVLREGSTLAASRRLGMAQPTVARRIDALEHEIGLTLFVRDTRGFHPTEAARELMPAAEALEKAAQGFHETVGGLKHARPIRVTAYLANFSPRITAIFSEFLAIRPDVRFDFLPGVQVLDLMAGEADVALRITRSPIEPDLICRKISTAQFSLYAAPTYAEKYGLPRSPDDLKGHRLLTFQRHDIPPVFHEWILKHASPDQIVLSFSEIDMMHSAIRAGRGLGIANLRLAEGDPSLIRCFDPVEELSAEHVLLVSPEAYRRPEVKEFVKFLAPRYAALFR